MGGRGQGPLRCFRFVSKANFVAASAAVPRPRPFRGCRMSKKPARTSNGPRPGINDDIGEETRLRMYRMQVELREAEQRAYDLFLQNLVKGTSHLALGQEAVATGFAAAMEPGDL